MAVECEYFNVIVPKSVIETKYLGGLSAYRENCPNLSFAEDDHLTRVGFMNPGGAGNFIDGIESKGLEYLDENEHSKDFVVMMMFARSHPCGWIETDIMDGIKCCWLKGTEPRPITLLYSIVAIPCTYNRKHLD